MSGEKKRWRMSTRFQNFTGKQGLPLRHCGSRVSSVYLSDDSSTNGFIIVPEFDGPVRAETPHEESNHISHLPAVKSSNPLPNGVDGYLYDLEPIGSQHLGGGSCDSPVVNASRDDDLTHRLGSAYEHIRSMPSAASPKVMLSSDPQILRKQLGVPQHSVINYPVHSSPDLPNPHTSSPESTSPRMSPATSSDMSHARTSKKLELRINTNVSPRHRFPDPFQPAQRKSMVTAPTHPENSPSERSTLGEPWSAHDACSSKAQLPMPNPSTLVKRSVEQPIVSSSSFPSTLQALRGVLRKPAVDTPPSTNASRWQVSLPQIRPPSPFRVDIPLHHTWRDRRSDFNSPSESHETKSRRASGSTDILASLAWIGTPLTASGPYTANRGRQPASPAFLPDRFNMAIAVEDDSISDDVLVNQLEKVRRIGSPSEWDRDVSPLRFSGDPHFRNLREDANGLFPTSYPSSSLPSPDHLVKPCDVSQPFPLTSKDTSSGSDDAAVWQAARKALLCIREIIRTEKKYQEALKMLLNAQTATPPPPSMTPYVSALVRASEMLLKYFLEDPSAWGVSTAFVTSEDELEATMASWCAVVGGFFTDANYPQSSGLTSKWRLRKSGIMSSSASSPMTKQTLSPQLPPMISPISTASKTNERTNEESGKYLLSEQERKTTFRVLA
ncbi:hypothetical protein J3R82DRAFT_545 [Butyriboletus roseoflavus]|nr:hypothetical protein J3R82DRAFT_545 [Butyriboletus roseoflavus]